MNKLLNQNKSFDKYYYLSNNNFNLLRLFAVIQVFLTHSINHLKIKNEWVLCFFNNFLVYFPGVPIFFAISGFLIYASYEKNHLDVANFYKNRFLRIYPGLFVCVLFTTILLFIDFPNLRINFFSGQFFIWFFTQISIFQFYTPDMLRFWGVGTPNGSLWTVSIEIQFYILIPFLFFILSYFKRWYIAFFILFFLSILVNITFNERVTIFEKLYHEFVFKYLYYFMFGIFAFKMWDKISFVFVNQFFVITSFFVVYSFIFGVVLGYRIEYYIIESIFGFGSNILLSLWTFSFAFTKSSLNNNFIKDKDFSYGTYLYHMPVINFLCHNNYKGSIKYMIIAFCLTSILAIGSWFLIEKKALKFKRN